MMRFVQCAALESNRSRAENRQFDPNTAVGMLLTSVYKRASDAEIDARLGGLENRLETFSDRDLIFAELKATGMLTDDDTTSDLKAVELRLKSKDMRGYWLRTYAIAEVVEARFGYDERGKYIVACLDGRAV